jgi:hypothetical protein
MGLGFDAGPGSLDDFALVRGLVGEVVGSVEADFEDSMARVCLPLAHLSFWSDPAESYSAAELAFADLVHLAYYFAGQWVSAEPADSMHSPVVSPVPDSDGSAVEHHSVHVQEVWFDSGLWADGEDRHSGLV